MNTPIHNIQDIKNEIARLRLLKKEQESYLSDQYVLLRHKIEAPARMFSMLSDKVPGMSAVKGVFSAVSNVAKNEEKADWLTRGLQIGLPLVLNRTLLKNAGWLKKSLVLLASETAASQINKNSIDSVIGKVANFIRPAAKRRNAGKPSAEHADGTVDFGIPPDSETY